LVEQVSEGKPIEVVGEIKGKKSKQTKSKQTEGKKKPQRKRSGVVAKIHQLWEEGLRTEEEIIARLQETGLKFSPATVKTQLYRLRREAGITMGRGRRGRGVVAKIKELWEAGIRTKKEVMERLQAEGIEASPATVSTQLAKLRREEKKKEVNDAAI